MHRIASATRYLGTYLALLQHFALIRGWRFGLMMVAVIANAVLHPIPFLLLAELLRGAQAGASELSLGWHSYAIHLRPDAAVLAVFLAGSAAFLMSYAVGRLVNAETVAWQGRIFWLLVGRLTRIARWDQTLDLGVQMRPLPLAQRIDTALRGAFPIARLIETGTRDAMMVVILVSLLIWQDARDMAVLGFLSLLFVPAYAMALSRLVRMQAKSNASQQRLRQPVLNLLTSDVMRRSGRRIDGSDSPEAATEVLSRGYGSQSHLLNEQNAVTVVAGVHVFAAFYGVYLSEGRSLMALPAEKLTFFFFLVLMLRSLIGLVGLLSRLSRGYERLGLLRIMLFPQSKSTPAGGGLAHFAVTAHQSAAPPKSIAAGETMALLLPDMAFGFQLLPLSNGLFPEFTPAAGVTRHIPLLREIDVPALLAGGIISGEAGQLRLPNAGTVAIMPQPLDLALTPVVALTIAAWERLVREKAVARANAERVLVVAVTGWTIPASLPEGIVYALSNGILLTAVGDRAAIAAPLAELAAGGKVNKSTPDDADGELEQDP